MTIGPPIPKIQFDLENSSPTVKVKGTPVSAASSWLISLVFHIRASYRLPPLLFHYNRASHSRDTIWPWKVKVKGQGQRHPSQRSIQLTHFLLFHFKRTDHSKDMANRMFDWWKIHLKFYAKIHWKKKILRIPPRFDQVESMTTKFCSYWMSGSHFIVGTC